MKIRSKDDLLRVADEDRAWRIMEIAQLKSSAFSSSLGMANRNAIRRAIFPMAYAHWEGYVKKVGQAYVDYVATSKPKLKDLSPSFQSLYFSVENSMDLKRANRSALIPIIKRLETGKEDRIHIRTKDIVSTQSNLSSVVLEDICVNLGLDFKIYNDFISFFDKVLLAKRNGIAHGEYIPFNERDIEEISQKTVICIDIFKWQIEDEVARDGYTVAPKRPAYPPTIPTLKIPA